MERRDFIKKAALSTALINSVSLLDVFASSPKEAIKSIVTIDDLASISPALNLQFKTLLTWCINNHWISYLKLATGLQFDVNLNLDSITPDRKDHLRFTGEIDNIKKVNGFDDFKGKRLIEPGDPAGSLLYHALASPRVKDAAIAAYPDIEQLDFLENYIYAIKSYNVLGELPGDYTVAVFAYQYRPALKTPHQNYADLVFSRTGISRIGDQPMNYDHQNRCHTNKPSDPLLIKKIAVTPARYGLFLARSAGIKDISLMQTTSSRKQGGFRDRYDASNDRDRTFIVPVRKLFNEDLLTANCSFSFTESHTGQKLNALFKRLMLGDFKGYPYILTSADLIYSGQDTYCGSSFLVCPKNGDLVKAAIADKKRLSIKITADDRYFTTFETDNSVEVIEILAPNGREREPNQYVHFRNAPLYLNIRNPMNDQQLTHLDGDTNPDLEKKVMGSYNTALFLDGICDGSVGVSNITLHKSRLDGLITNAMPAFSVVTAPDFFPLVDTMDLLGYDVAPGNGRESNFVEGGLANLSCERIPADPNILKPGTEIKAFPNTEQPYDTAFTITAVLSVASVDQNNKWLKDYPSISFLPDTCSSIFAPGWDMTYASDDGNSSHIYLTTKGLGSPFPEDMKLCAAMNGMWAAASPDAARTFQGSVFTNQYAVYRRNPTAIPLMDDEIGYHKNSPYNDFKKVKEETFGWDGEQGPYLVKDETGVRVNFTDLGRADYVANAMADGSDPGFQPFDMSKLRDLESNELIARMECLKKCVHKIQDNLKSIGFTDWWLVSAEKVNWKNESPMANGIPLNLVGDNKRWITDKSNAMVEGHGYLFVFVLADFDGALEDVSWDQLSSHIKRRWQKCSNIRVCQVTPERGAVYTEVLDGQVNWV